MFRFLSMAAALTMGLALSLSAAPAAAQAVPNPYAQMIKDKPALTLDEGQRVLAALRDMQEAGLFTDEVMSDLEGAQVSAEGLAIVRDHGFSIESWADAMLKVSDGLFAVAMEEAGMATGDYKSANAAVMRQLREEFESLEADMAE